MAQRIEIHLIDDLDGSEIRAGKGETITFALDGTSYEIDLTNRNAVALRKALSTYVAAARPMKARGGRSKRSAQSDAREVKAWARQNGFEVADRGRVPSHIRDAYAAAH
jgi:hypothetical protein